MGARRRPSRGCIMTPAKHLKLTEWYDILGAQLMNLYAAACLRGVDRKVILRWEAQGKLAPTAHDERGRPLYLRADVLAVEDDRASLLVGRE